MPGGARNVWPLGSGALAGAGYPLDREATATELGFDGVTRQLARRGRGSRLRGRDDLAAIALGMVHLSRLAEEITWWSNPRFGFVRASDAFSTGSSMMPNKKNPDPAELVRGRAARVIGELTGTLTLLKGLPAGVPARPAGETRRRCSMRSRSTRASLEVMAGHARDADASTRERMRAAADEGYTTATAVADALVRRGVPFRTAHHVVGSLVAQAEEDGLGLDEVPDAMIGRRWRQRRADGGRAGRGARDRRRAAGGGLDRRGPRVVRRHRRDGAGARRGGPRRGPGAPRPRLDEVALELAQRPTTP